MSKQKAGTSSGGQPLAPGWKISTQRYDKHKAVNPFDKKVERSPFALAYDSGVVCARINHGSITNRLKWDVFPEDLPYDPLLITCAEGLVETKHPFVFVARNAFAEMLEAPGATAKTIPLLSRIVPGIRRALQGTETYEAGLDALKQLSSAVGPALDPHLSTILSQLNRKMFDRKMEPKISETLRVLSENGSDQARAVIRSKVPTFQFV